jgi:hypothetical protein
MVLVEALAASETESLAGSGVKPPLAGDFPAEAGSKKKFFADKSA